MKTPDQIRERIRELEKGIAQIQKLIIMAEHEFQIKNLTERVIVRKSEIDALRWVLEKEGE